MSEPSRIRELVQARLAGRTIDLVGFVDELLGLARRVGEIRCSLATERSLRLELGGQTCEVELDAAQAKLRMVCARLSLLCSEAKGSDVSPYGGQGTITSSGAPLDEWKVCFKNTPGEQEFTIAFVSNVVSSRRTEGSKTKTV